jgi:hypothetical protein
LNLDTRYLSTHCTHTRTLPPRPFVSPLAHLHPLQRPIPSNTPPPVALQQELDFFVASVRTPAVVVLPPDPAVAVAQMALKTQVRGSRWH